MKAHKISQKNLAQTICLKYSTLRFWLSYGYYPDVKTAYDIATTLGVSMEYLLTGKDKRTMKNHKRAVSDN